MKEKKRGESTTNKEKITIDTVKDVLEVWRNLNENLEETIKKLAINKLINKDTLNKIKKLKSNLRWDVLPYNNLKKFIDEINHPLNISKDAKDLLKLIAPIVFEILTKIKTKLEERIVKLKEEKIVKLKEEKEEIDYRIIYIIDSYRTSLLYFFTKTSEPTE